MILSKVLGADLTEVVPHSSRRGAFCLSPREGCFCVPALLNACRRWSCLKPLDRSRGRFCRNSVVKNLANRCHPSSHYLRTELFANSQQRWGYGSDAPCFWTRDICHLSSTQIFRSSQQHRGDNAAEKPRGTKPWAPLLTPSNSKSKS